jgi:hypothetical protein
MKWPGSGRTGQARRARGTIRETGSMSFCIAQRKYLIKITSFCASL